MNVVDTSGWVEYIVKGKNGPDFLPIIREIKNLIVPTIVIYEVFKRVTMLIGVETALVVSGVMSEGYEAGLDRAIAINAAQISIDKRLSMADSLILATAQAYNATLWTQDAHFKDFDGVRYIEKSV
jgi:toxin FitB